MGFRKIELGKEEIFTTTIQREDGSKDGKWVVMKKDYPEVVKILNKKYGLNLKIITKSKDRDLDWAK